MRKHVPAITPRIINTRTMQVRLDTLFADMYQAYEMLSQPMKAFLGTLTAVHDGALPYVGAYKSTPPEGGYPKHEHPVITRHPETHRPVLYVNRGFTSHIKGLAPKESKTLLELLFRHKVEFSVLKRIHRIQQCLKWSNSCLLFRLHR